MNKRSLTGSRYKTHCLVSSQYSTVAARTDTTTDGLVEVTTAFNIDVFYS